MTELEEGKLYRASKLCQGVSLRQTITGDYRKKCLDAGDIVIALGRNRILGPRGVVLCLLWAHVSRLELLENWK